MANATRNLPTSKQWEQQKGRLTKLYLEELKTVPQIVEIMSHDGFTANEGHYKKKFRLWRIQKKNIPAADKEILMKEKLRRDGMQKKSVFLRGGREVPEERVQRGAPKNQDPSSIQAYPYTLPVSWECKTPPEEIPTPLNENHHNKHSHVAFHFHPSPSLSAPFDLAYAGGGIAAWNNPGPAHTARRLEEYVGVAEGSNPVDHLLLGIPYGGTETRNGIWLHGAIERGNLPEIQNLLNYIHIFEPQALEARDDTWNERTPLHHAVENGSCRVAELLLGFRPNTEALTTMHGETPLHIAYRLGNKPMIELLLANGASVGAMCFCPGTPLHVSGGCAGVKTTEMGSGGQTPVAIARANRDSEVPDILGHLEDSMLRRIAVCGGLIGSGGFYVKSAGFGRGPG